MQAILQETLLNLAAFVIAMSVTLAIILGARYWKRRDKYHYTIFIYALENHDGSSGAGNIDVKFTNWPPSVADIRDVEDQIRKTFRYSGVVMTNILPVSKDRED